MQCAMAVQHMYIRTRTYVCVCVLARLISIVLNFSGYFVVSVHTNVRTYVCMYVCICCLFISGLNDLCFMCRTLCCVLLLALPLPG